MMIEIGSPLPPFSLPDQTGTSVSGVALAGHWTVLYFYPKDMTPGCTTEAEEFSELLPQFEALGVLLWGISPDSPETHAQFQEKRNLTVNLLSDSSHEFMERVGSWGEKVLYGKRSVGVKRSTVIVAPDGTVAWVWKAARAKGHAVKVLEKIRELTDAG